MLIYVMCLCDVFVSYVPHQHFGSVCEVLKCWLLWGAFQVTVRSMLGAAEPERSVWLRFSSLAVFLGITAFPLMEFPRYNSIGGHRTDLCRNMTLVPLDAVYFWGPVSAFCDWMCIEILICSEETDSILLDDDVSLVFDQIQSDHQQKDQNSRGTYW